MADISVNMGNAPSTAGFSDISRGATPRKAQEFAVDKSAAMKVQGQTTTLNMAASLFDTGMKAADSIIKQNIDQTTTAAMDQIYSEFGVDSAALEGKPATQDTPPSEINTAVDNLARLSKARERGTINENSYWARVESVSRQLRARFPGHRDYTDQRIAQVSGGKPANEILRNLMQESAKAAAANSASMKQRDQLAEQLSKEGILPDNWESMDHHTLINATALPRKQKAAIDYDMANLNLAKAKNEATGELATTAARTLVSNYVTEGHTALTNGLPEYKTFVTSMTEAAKRSTNNTIDDATVNEVRTNFNNFRTKFVSTLQSDMNEKFGGTLTEAQMKDAMSPAMRFLDTYENALTNKDYGQLVELSHRKEAMKNSDTVKMMSAFPTLRANAAVNANLGEIASNTYLEYSTSLMNPTDKALFSETLTRLWSDPNYSVNQAMLDHKAKGLGKETNTATINALIDNLQNPNIKIDGTVQIGKMLYGEKNASMLNTITDPKQRLAAYSRMVNPTIYQRMKDLKDAGHPEIYDNYVGWVQFNFSNLVRDKASTLVQQLDKFPKDAARVKFDDANGQFFIDKTIPLDPVRTGLPFSNFVGPAVDYIRSGILDSTVNDINTTLRGVMPIVKDTDQSPREFITNVFGGLGLDTSTIKSTSGEPSKLGGPTLVSGPTPAPKRTKPGEVGPNGDVQLTPQQGDTMQMNELSTFITQKRQDLQLYNQMINEDPNNSQAIDLYEKTLLQWSDAVKELNSLSQQWLQEFSREAKKVKPTS